MLEAIPTTVPPLFKTTPVDRRVALRAWPLVQLSHPGVTREEWLSYAISTGKRLGKTGGAVAIEDSRGYIHALFSWSVTRTISHRRAMRVCDMVVGALPGQRLAETIVAAVRDVAAEIEADSVLIEIGDRQLAPDALLSDGFEHLVMHCVRIARSSEGVT
ncbi:MAG: hypothetical protein K2Y29_06235 [Beijerinckiaceae bacterium]|nr:hypothetical protein [Beijerinckiaceae bacterium]